MQLKKKDRERHNWVNPIKLVLCWRVKWISELERITKPIWINYVCQPVKVKIVLTLSNYYIIDIESHFL